MNIGQAVRELRKERGIKSKDFSKKIGLSNGSLIAIEKNRSFPTKSTIKALCDGLGIPVSILMLHSITEDDIPEDNREASWALLKAIKEILK